MKKLSIIASSLLLSSSIYAQNISILTGWQLFGAVEDINVSTFNNSCVDFVWKYDSNNVNNPHWQLHIANGINYSTASNYSPIESLNTGDGFWVQGNDSCNVSTSLVDTNTTILNSTIWYDIEPDGYFNFYQAKSYCENNGYRLPTGDELIEVWNYYGSTASPQGFEKDTFYWGEDANGSVRACPMDVDCSQPWTDMSLTGNGHPKCIVDSSLNLVNNITFKGIVYGTVTSPFTGKKWLDRNLGASQICTSLDDSACYGDYYQWGRLADGHEKTTNSTTILSETINLAGDSFILSTSTPYDWSTADTNGSLRSASWSLSDGTGICPYGFRVPTISEIKADTIDLDTVTLTNILKLPQSGYHNRSDGSFGYQGQYGYLWSSSIGGIGVASNYSQMIGFGDDGTRTTGVTDTRATGYTIRCIKN